MNPIIVDDVMKDRFRAFSGGCVSRAGRQRRGRRWAQLREPIAGSSYNVIQASLVDTWAGHVGGRLRDDREQPLHGRSVQRVSAAPPSRMASSRSRTGARTACGFISLLRTPPATRLGWRRERRRSTCSPRATDQRGDVHPEEFAAQRRRSRAPGKRSPIRMKFGLVYAPVTPSHQTPPTPGTSTARLIDLEQSRTVLPPVPLGHHANHRRSSFLLSEQAAPRRDDLSSFDSLDPVRGRLRHAAGPSR